MLKKFLTTVLFLLVAITLFAQSVSHVVKRGETLKSIAKMYNLSEKVILDANPGVHSRALVVGSTLKIPLSSYSETKPAPSANQTTEESEIKSSSSTANHNLFSAPVSSFQESINPKQVITASNNVDYGRGVYFHIAYAHPLLKKSVRDYFDSNWGLKFGVGVDFSPFESPLFLSFGNDVFLNWYKIKGLDKTVCTMQDTFPLQLGYGKRGWNIRAGGALGFGMSFEEGSKAVFTYGLKFNIQLLVDIGFELIWSKDVKEASKLLTIGFRF